MNKIIYKAVLTIIIFIILGVFYFGEDKSIIVSAAKSENIKITAEVLRLESAGILKNFSTSKKLFEFANVDFQIVFQNIGTTSITTYGNIKIENLLHKNVVTLNINPERITTNVGQTTKLTPTWTRKSYLGFGKYTAFLDLRYGQQNNITASLSYWVFPIRMIAALILIIILILNRPKYAPVDYGNNLLTLRVRDEVVSEQSK
ncbi:MAG: hypothetical protein M1338_01495 [Patescibacteria group bacterium]|nr:hypothetical protein [Patescibacteria group bacterium]